MKVCSKLATFLTRVDHFVMTQANAMERSRMASGEESEQIQEKSWIELTFQKRECTTFLPIISTSTDLLSRCGCGRLLSDHQYLNAHGLHSDDEYLPAGVSAHNYYGKLVVVSENQRENRKDETSFVNFSNTQSMPKHEDIKWNNIQHTSLFPTDAHGTLEFQGTGEGDKSQYIRLSNDTSPDTVLKLLIDEWKLNPPKMVITVHGGAHNFQLQQKLHRVFCNGLVKAAKTTGAWIMTFGLNTGVGVIVGDALKEHKARSRGKIVSIGVAPWGVVDHREDLIGSEPISAYQTMGNPLSKGSVLHAAHTHFLLVDNGTEGRYDSELRFRRQLERRLSQQQFHPHQGRTSVVCLVLEGGKNTINVVLESVRQNPPIPVIVCDGSGRAADLLAFAHQYVDEDGTMMEELKVQLLALIQETFKCNRDQAQYFYISIMECVRKKELITIFRMGNGYEQDDIDIAILTATLKAQCKSAPDMLNLALSWNRIDIAMSQIFVYGRQWPVMSLEQAMMDALINDRVDFVKLLMENGVSMHKFLTVSRLEELYNARPPVNLVYLINDVKKNIPPGYRFTLIDIGQVIELLMGGAYRSSYTRKRFRMYYASKVKSEPSMKKQISFRMGLNAFGNSTSLSRAESAQPMLLVDTRPPEVSHSILPHFAYPFHELLIWAVLMKRQKMALCMWQQGEEAIAKALVACKLYKTMAKEAADDDLDVEESDQLKAYSKEFQNLAIQLLEICYHADDDATQHLLTYELKHWSRQTCLSLAVAAKHRDFIAHPCVQLLLNDLWMGGLSERKNSGVKVIVGILIPPTLLMLDFKTQEELQLMPQTMEEHMHDVSSLSSSVEGSSSSSSSESSSSSSSSSKSATSLPKPEVLGKQMTEHRDQDAYMILMARPKQLTLSKKVYEFYNAPITKFWMYAMAYMCVLLLFTYVVLVKMEILPSVAEWIVISHVITMTIEKVREIVVSEPSGAVQKLKVWGGNFWNVMDAITILMFYTALVLRLAFPYVQDPSSNQYILLVGRSIYCVNIVLWYTHLLNVFSVNKHLGPYVMLMGKMMVDLATFIILLAVVLTSFGVARQSILHPQETWSWSLIKHVMMEPYFMLYGEVYAGTIDPCDGDDASLCVVGSWIAPTLMTLYLLIANILLLNLLIAVFNNTFARVKNYSDRIWKFQRYLTILEYELRPVVPPPLILISYIVMIFRRICKKRKSTLSDRGLKLFLDDDDVEKLHDFEEDCVDEYFRSKVEGLEKKDSNKAEERLDHLLDSMEEMCQREAFLTNHIVDMHERLASLEEANMRILEMYSSGSHVRSRRNTGRTESLSGHENDPHLHLGGELSTLPEVTSARAWWSVRQRGRRRQDSEMSTASDWHQLNYARSRTISQDRSKAILDKARLSDIHTKPLRRTNSTGILVHKNPQGSMIQSEDSNKLTGFKPSNQLPLDKDDNKSLSCQDIMLLGTNQSKPSVADACQHESFYVQDIPQTIITPSTSEERCNVATSVELQRDLFATSESNVSTSDRDSPADMFLGVSESGSQHSVHDHVRQSQSCFNLKSNFEQSACVAQDEDPSTSSTPMPQDPLKSPPGSSSTIRRNKSFDKKGGSRKFLNITTPGINIQSSPATKQTYKSITDQIDTSRWHEMYAPHAPTTPFDGWWNGKAGPDFDSHRPIKFSDQTSLSEWDEDSQLTKQKKGRSKGKVQGRHRKRTKRSKKGLAQLPELPSTSQLNINNNSTESTFPEHNSTFPRSRRLGTGLVGLSVSKSQTLCDDNTRLL